MDCSPPGSSVHGILQARRLEWIAIPFSRDVGGLAQCSAWLSLQAPQLSYVLLGYMLQEADLCIHCPQSS